MAPRLVELGGPSELHHNAPQASLRVSLSGAGRNRTQDAVPANHTCYHYATGVLWRLGAVGTHTNTTGKSNTGTTVAECQSPRQSQEGVEMHLCTPALRCTPSNFNRPKDV